MAVSSRRTFLMSFGKEWECLALFNSVFHHCCVWDEVCDDDFDPKVILSFDMSLG